MADSWGVSLSHGAEHIYLPDGSRWMVQAANDGAGVSMSISMALVDEAWRVRRDVVDGAIDPTMMESEQPQLWLVSTAGDSSSDLMLVYRAAGIAGLKKPAGLLMVEWSAPPKAPVADPESWRMASPHFTPRREAEVRDKLQKASLSEFKAQYLNQWVQSIASDDQWIVETTWAKLASSSTHERQPLVVCVEDNAGEGSCVAWAWLSEGIIYADAQTMSLAEAWARAAELMASADGSQLLVGITLKDSPEIRAMGVEAELVGGSQTRAALPAVRNLIREGRFRHCSSESLDAQVIGLKVRPSTYGGLSCVSSEGTRTDAARSMARAVLVCHQQLAEAPAIF